MKSNLLVGGFKGRLDRNAVDEKKNLLISEGIRIGKSTNKITNDANVVLKFE